MWYVLLFLLKKIAKILRNFLVREKMRGPHWDAFKASTIHQITESLFICKNHWWHGRYSIWANSKNFVVLVFLVKKVKKNEKMKKNCSTKVKLDSKYTEYQAKSENVLYVNFFIINRRARASAMRRKAYLGGRCAYTLMHAGASKRVEILN